MVEGLRDLGFMSVSRDLDFSTYTDTVSRCESFV